LGKLEPAGADSFEQAATELILKSLYLLTKRGLRAKSCFGGFAKAPQPGHTLESDYLLPFHIH